MITYYAALLDPENHTTKRMVVSEDRFHQDCYKLIRCNCLTFTHASADNINYVIISDDFGLNANRPYSIYGGGINIPGPCVILGDDGEQDVRSLSELELKRFGVGSGNGTAIMGRSDYYMDRSFKTPYEAEQFLNLMLEDC